MPLAGGLPAPDGWAPDGITTQRLSVFRPWECLHHLIHETNRARTYGNAFMAPVLCFHDIPLTTP